MQEVCWIAQSKNLFKFGILKSNSKNDQLDEIFDIKFRQKTTLKDTNTSLEKEEGGILIALEHLDLDKYRSKLTELREKSFTLIYTTNTRHLGQEIRRILTINEYEVVNLDHISDTYRNHLIYAWMMAQIKEYNE